MSAQNETNPDVIVFDNLRRPSGDVAGSYTPVKAKAFQPAESFKCSNAAGHTRVVDSRDSIAELASVSGKKIKAAFGK